ncbi:MAG: polymerase sigma factor, sigma-70 family [Verrucomicrobiales bacterium]|nr:polymerase sigma factor, sigma-70 family [Verrucomicrobiales bacterium]
MGPDTMTMLPAADPLVVEAARLGDADAFAQLCATIEDRLLRQANFLCKDPDAAQDLAQETLFAAWKSIRKYNGECRFFTWVCGIMIRQYRNYLRKSRRFPLSFSWFTGEADSHDLNLENLICESEIPGAGGNRDLDTYIRLCLLDLSPKHREVVYLRFYANDSMDGIARALGCSTGTVKSRLFHAMAHLRKMKARLNELR